MKSIRARKLAIGVLLGILTFVVLHPAKGGPIHFAAEHGEHRNSALLTEDGSSQADYVFAVNGTAFLIREQGGAPQLQAINTVLPVFKAFSLSKDRRKLLYSPLRNGIPSGELYVEDIVSGDTTKVPAPLVITAEMSPADPDEVAYTFAGGAAFGLAVLNISSGQTRMLVPQGVLADIIGWDSLGRRIHYFECADESQVLTLSAHSVPAGGESSGDDSIESVPTGFPVLDHTSTQTLSVRSSGPDEQARIGASSFRVTSPDGQREVLGDSLLGSTSLYVRSLPSAAPRFLAEGQLLRILNEGIVLKRFLEAGTSIEYVEWNGSTKLLGTASVSGYTLPLSSLVVTQGGAGYSSPGNCNLSTHTGSSTSAFAYDMQNSTTGAHIRASNDGLVVYTFSTVTCNSLDTNGCADYSSTCASNGRWGNVVIIQHSDGTFTKYAHMQRDSIQVTINSNACQGQYIGRQGHTGDTSGNMNGCGDHLHFQRQSTSALSGSSVAVTFSDTASNPLSCGVSYTSGSTEVTTCSAYVGYHDGVDCDKIFGWAWNSTQPTNTVNVNIYDGSSLIAGNVPANQFRSDLPGGGFHAFNYPTPAFLKNGLTHSIRVEISANGQNLINTPRVFNSSSSGCSSSCSYSISPSSQSFSPSGGSGAVSVSAPTGCGWSASSSSSWITITSGSSGSGNGTVNYSVASNGSTNSRAGTMTVAGRTFTVNQAGASGGNPAIASPVPGSTLSGSAATFVWSAGSGISQYFLYVGNSVGANDIYGQSQGTNLSGTVGGIPTDGRTIYVRLWWFTSSWQFSDYTYRTGGTTSCTYSLSPTSQSFSASGGTGSVNVSAPSGCGWSANSGTSWITITSGNTGSGNGTVNYSVASIGSTGSRSASIAVAGRTFTVNQAGATTCTFSISPSSQSFSPSGGSGTVSVSASTGCGWSASSSSSWITITSGSSGSGNGTVNYSVASNGSTNSRTGTMTVAGRTFTVNQAGASGGNPAITSPVPGSTLSGSTVTFVWSAGLGVSQYFLYVGNSVGANDIYGQSQGTNLSGTVGGIPTDGRTVYTRLWWFTSSWQFADYTYRTASGGGAGPAQITSPTPGSRLSGSTVTFVWTSASGASDYWIYVGNSFGANDILSQERGLNRTVTVTGIPTDGRTIYVRLWSFISGVWLWNDYAYSTGG